MIGVRGPLQREGEVIHVIARTVEDLTPLLGTVSREDTDGGTRPVAHAAEGDKAITVRARDFR